VKNLLNHGIPTECTCPEALTTPDDLCRLCTLEYQLLTQIDWHEEREAALALLERRAA
jgi:hypothetical protein